MIKNMKTRFKRLVAVGITAVALGASLAACTQVGASSDMLGVVVGDGTNGNVSVKDVLYPGETHTVNNEDIFYFPGNSRNYVIDSKASTNVDRTTPATGRTNTGTSVNVNVTAFWTINQDESFLKNKFWGYCKKYQCASSDPDERNNLSATDGWVDMLNSDMSPAIDEAVRKVIPKYDDSIWKTQSDWDLIAADLSKEFTAAMAARTGITDNIYCGSGDVSGWNGGEPGTKDAEFTCGPVRFTITSVENQNKDVQKGQDEQSTSQSIIDQNEQLRLAAEAKYGDKAGEILGTIDILKACAETSSCTVVIDGSGDAVISPPVVETPTE